MSGNEGGFNAGQQPRGKVEQAKARLTPEEARVLKECNQESFWYRCVPMGIAFIGATQMMVNKGMLRPHPRYGALFKNVGAGFCAFVMGKVSYQSTCREKIMRLENSPLAEMMRAGKDMRQIVNQGAMHQAAIDQQVEQRQQQQQQQQQQLAPAEAQAAAPLREYEGGYTDADSNVQHKGLDDTFRPSVDDESRRAQAQTAAAPQQGVSYAELRARNRVEHEQRQAAAQSPPPPRQPHTAPPQPQPQQQQQQQQSKQPYDWENEPIRRRSSGVRRNAYGDIIED